MLHVLESPPQEASHAERQRLESVLRFVKRHGFIAMVEADAVVIDIPYINVITRDEGIERVSVRTLSEARIALGY